MLQCCRISSGYFILRNYISKEKIQPLINGTSLENFEFIADDPNLVREKLLSIASKQKSAGEQKKFGSVPVDHAFNVKGVGIVVLGIVMDGVIQKHASLNVLPSAKVAIVRSIQKHDDEFETANEGDRVGLALKNVNVEDLDRGTVLTNDPSMKTCSRLQTQVSLVKYWQTPIKKGMVVHVGHWTQFLTAKIDASIESTDPKKPLLTLSLDKPIVYLPGDKAVLMYLEGAKLRVAGTLSL
jgi:selenocysteine-specific translation elongation factor